MTISVWRYGHLALAVSSFLFMILAALTGIILAFEPIGEKMSRYRVKDIDRITVAQAVTTLKKNYPGVTDVAVDANGFVTVKGTDAHGKKLDACVDPVTCKILGPPYRQSEFYQWVTAFHRSLFLHEAGRCFVGLISFLLLLIATSGTVLIIQRQRGVKRFFARIVKDGFAQYWHVITGRLSLIPIIIIALTGSYLTVARLNVFKNRPVKLQVDTDHAKTAPQRTPAAFDIFKNTQLADIRTLQFPFSDFPEDYFILKLKDREMAVNQFTGDILSEAKYPRSAFWEALSLTLHTGRGSIVWALILAIASANILFFIWSGFVITLKRRSGQMKNKFKPHESKIIILVGSENGSTSRYAADVYQQLIGQQQKVYLTELNNYQAFPVAEQLIIMTATYGLGDAPSNASKFAELFNKYPQPSTIHYSVAGFGSHAYPDFCRFAFEVHQLLLQSGWAKPLIDIHTINDRSPADINLWAEAWSQQSGLQLSLSHKHNAPLARSTKLQVTSTTAAGNGRTFILRLSSKKRLKVTSGDLLAIYPANDHRERLYSIGMIGNEIQLSVRLHSGGLGSEFLHRLVPGDLLKARLVSNPHFHFPANGKPVIMVANGTGIAPFLGMIHQHNGLSSISLYCGFRDSLSYEPYSDLMSQQLNAGKLRQLSVALSREGEKRYVSDLMAADARSIGDMLEQGGTVMLCGSLAMQHDVLRLLGSVCEAYTKHRLSHYQAKGQILMDCY